MRICIAGKNNIAVESTQYLINDLGIDKKKLVACFNKTDDGQDSFQLSFKKFCIQEGIESLSLAELYQLTDFIFISLEFDQLLQMRKMKTKKVFNIHFSLLPKYRGMYTSVWPILFGDRQSGVTLHCIDRGIDTGDIIEQLTFPISEDDTCRSLYLKYIEHGILLFKNSVHHLLSGDYSAKAQQSIDCSYYSQDSIDFSNIKINFNQPAVKVKNQISAFSFQEYQLPIIYGTPVQRGEILALLSTKTAGTVIREDQEKFDVATTDYHIRCYKS